MNKNLLVYFTWSIFIFLISACSSSRTMAPAHPQVNFTETERQHDSVLVTAGPHYYRSGLHHFFWGKHYRQIWAVPVKAEVFDIKSEKGGLKPLQMGGSFQTKNLRVQDDDGNEYVLRSIDKDPTKALPEFFQKTFVANWMRDQTSVIHPYGAFIVPKLAGAAGVYHTNPELFFIPNDPALGEYQNEFANMLVLFEERPDGSQGHVESFGNPQEVVSSRKAFNNIYNNVCDHMDREQYLRSRLFDMWIGDWSRREDQWRWGIFEEESGAKIYKPIPRDRDHAFFKFKDGFFTRIISWFRPNYQTFSEKYGNVKGLNNSARPMDDVLLAYLSREDFSRIAQDLQHRLNDAEIENALHIWPDTIYQLTGKEFSDKLKSRRNLLDKTADTYYKILAKEILLVGTDDEETFKIDVLNKNEVRIRIIRNSKKCPGSEVLADRVFNRKETKKIKLYGLGDEDVFEFTGTEKSPIKIDVYPGAGEDEVIGKGNASLKNVTIYNPDDGDSYENISRAKVKEYKPKAQDFSAEGWLLRHRLD